MNLVSKKKEKKNVCDIFENKIVIYTFYYEFEYKSIWFVYTSKREKERERERKRENISN